MHKNEALPCPAGLDPASHPVETVGTRRVALGHASMGLRVEARKDTENEHVDTCDQPLKRWLVQKNEGFVG